jgi:hypothetical protein
MSEPGPPEVAPGTTGTTHSAASHMNGDDLPQGTAPARPTRSTRGTRQTELGPILGHVVCGDHAAVVVAV